MENDFKDETKSPGSLQAAIEFNFIKHPEEILNELISSKENGNAVGITTPILGSEVFITAVDDIIIDDHDMIIVLKPYDSSGYILPNNRIYLSQIVSVCPMKSAVKNPYLENLGKEKKWFF